MAGSSMDGLDVAEVSFTNEGYWSYEITRSNTYLYEEDVYDYLRSAASQNKEQQEQIDQLFGEWIANKVLDFGIDEVDLIAVHGHTVVHGPENGVSWQLGDGAIIAERTKIKTICDFRSLDVSINGQGAPLVPVGDFHLLSEFDGCLNLGGIANVSIQEKKMAWDICSCNQVLNFFANQLGEEYDQDGLMARDGTIDVHWKETLTLHPFYDKVPPKSLPNQFIDEDTLHSINPLNGLRTYTSFIAESIVKDCSLYLEREARLLVTGGGANNKFLMELLNANDKGLQFELPEKQLIEYKEAMIFAFLGVLKTRGMKSMYWRLSQDQRETLLRVLFIILND